MDNEIPIYCLFMIENMYIYTGRTVSTSILGKLMKLIESFEIRHNFIYNIILYNFIYMDNFFQKDG